MSEPAIDTGFSSAFATFDGELSHDRIAQLFSDRSLADRAASLAIWLVASLIMFALGYAMGMARETPEALRWTISVGVSTAMFGYGLLTQFGAWRRRRWLRWNGFLSGRYRVILNEDFFDVRAERFAARVSYGRLAIVDSGRSCIRIAFDSRSCRAILLPIADCQPRRTVAEVKRFIREQRADAKRRPLTETCISAKDPPIPLVMTNGDEQMMFDGPLRQGVFLDAEEADKTEARRARIRGVIYAVIAICFAVLLILQFIARNEAIVPKNEWGRMVGFAVFLLFTTFGAIRLRSAKKKVRDDPDAAAGHLSGWLSPAGFAVHFSLRFYRGRLVCVRFG